MTIPWLPMCYPSYLGMVTQVNLVDLGNTRLTRVTATQVYQGHTWVMLPQLPKSTRVTTGNDTPVTLGYLGNLLG